MPQVSRKQIRDKVRFRFDIQNFGNPSDADLNIVIQDLVNELWDIAVSAAPPHRFSKDYTLAVTSGTITYDIKSAIPDFRSLQKLFLIEDPQSSRWRELVALPTHSRGQAQGPSSGCNLVVRYTPEPPQPNDDDNYPFLQDIVGGDIFVTEGVCAVIATRERRDPSPHESAKGQAGVRVATQMRRWDEGGIGQILDVEERDHIYPFTAWNPVMWYQMRDRNIDIYSRRVYW